jgi:phosphate transport system permease protein
VSVVGPLEDLSGLGRSGGRPYDPVVDDVPKRPAENPALADRVFRGIATGAALVCLSVILLTFAMLLWSSRAAFETAGIWNFLSDSVWSPADGLYGAFGLLTGTIVIALIALVVAVPMALAMALFINEYAPARVRVVLTSVVDLLAALPSLIYGLWGRDALQPHLTPIARWLNEHLSFLPFLRLDELPDPLTPLASVFTGSALIAGVIVGIMALPIITSVSRDVMAQAPRDQCEAAYGLGGTRWGMIRDVILPFAKTGITGAVLLGLGRALGETIAVALVIQSTVELNSQVLSSGASSVAGHIAIKFPEAGADERSALVAAGLLLFAMTFAVNFVATRIISRTKVKA